MQSIAYRAHNIKKINDSQYLSICKLINYNGYRKNEPNANIPKEKPNMLKYLVKYYLNDLGYTKKQLCEYLCIESIDYNKMYGLLLGDYYSEDNIPQKLRIIK